MKIYFLKIWFLTFCVVFMLFSCEKDAIEKNVPTTTQNQRPENRQNLITTEDAKDVAISFLNLNKNDGRSVVTKDDIKEVQTIVNEDEIPIMYVVNLKDSGGFVVISASFVERPILAYSENGNFDFETIDEYSVKQSLDNNLPVYLDGCRNRSINTKRIKPDIFGWIVESSNYTYSSCHAWVVDGFKQIKKVTQYASGRISKKYTSNGLVSCNWGWGSRINNMNGWYYFGTWNNEQNVDNGVGYIYLQHMIHNIKPKNN